MWVKRKPVFVEGGTFKSIIPLPDGKAIAINDTVKQRMTRVIQEFVSFPASNRKT